MVLVEVGEQVVGECDLQTLLSCVALQYAKKSRSAGHSLHVLHFVSLWVAFPLNVPVGQGGHALFSNLVWGV